VPDEHFWRHGGQTSHIRSREAAQECSPQRKLGVGEAEAV
jgi:hypothetical protein